MAVDSNIIRYTFLLKGEKMSFDIGLSNVATVSTQKPGQGELPKWTKLGYEQCACCPLKPETDSHCPAAVRMHEVLEEFKHLDSIDQVDVSVESERRTYLRVCDLQSGLNSMLGLLMATSGCPVVGQLRSMATFHVPFCSIEETLYRAIGAYLTKQYFENCDGRKPDWELKGLAAFYGELEELNQAFTERIRAIERSDAISNAMVIFFASSIVVASALEEDLQEYKNYFTGLSAEPPDDGVR
jgi:hypothetical protein